MEYSGIFIHTNSYDYFYIFSRKNDELYLEISLYSVEYGLTGPVDFEFKHNRIILGELYQPLSLIQKEYPDIYHLYQLSHCLTLKTEKNIITLRCVWKCLYLTNSLFSIEIDKKINSDTSFYTNISPELYSIVHNRINRITKCIRVFLRKEVIQIIKDTLNFQEDLKFQLQCAQSVCLIKKSEDCVTDDIIDLIGSYI